MLVTVLPCGHGAHCEADVMEREGVRREEREERRIEERGDGKREEGGEGLRGRP